jgi:hypothetical protein
MIDNEEWRGQPALAAKPRGTGPFYIVALAATGVSVDTSWHFFGEKLHITNDVERGLLFAVLEMALIACGYAMHHTVQRVDEAGNPGKPGPARVVAWALCGLSAYMALVIGGPVGGPVRVAAGPVLALVMLHLALGIAIRVRRGVSSGTWARVGRELRERALSRLGLADDNRPALERTRDRATDRAARLAAGGWLFRKARLARAVRASGVALDEGQRARMLRQVAALKNVEALMGLRASSPWTLPDTPRVSLTKVRPTPTAPEPVDLEATIARAVEAALATQKPRRPISVVPQESVPATTETPRGWAQKRQQMADAVTFVRDRAAAGTPPTAKEVALRFAMSESWGRDRIKEAMAQESPNGKSLTPQS